MIRRAAIVVLRAPEHEQRQWALLLEYCRSHHLVPTALIRRDPLAALALCRAGHVELVVAPCIDRQGILRNTDLPVEFIRPPSQRRPTPPNPNNSGALILQMLARGGTVEMVAQLLDLPLADVTAVASAQLAPRPATRGPDDGPQRATRQQPADHVWRRPAAVPR